MPIIVEDIDEQYDRWIAEKQKGIGSGDIPIIAGAGYQTPMDLWMTKTGRRPAQSDNDMMWWGRRMESAVADLYMRQSGIPGVRNKCMFGHESVEWARATPDYLLGPVAGELIIGELKTVGWRNARVWQDGGTPLAPRFQTQWQMGVTGIHKAKIIALVGGDARNLEIREEEFSIKIFGQMVEMADRFLYHVRTNTPPIPTHQDAKNIEEIVGELKERTVVFQPGEDAELDNAIVRYHGAKGEVSLIQKQLKEWKKVQDQAKNEISIAMGDAAHALYLDMEFHVKEISVCPRPYTSRRFTSKGTLDTAMEDEE